MYRVLLKPIFDRLAAFIALIIFLPFILCFTLFLFKINKGKPFFIQNRPGKDGKTFRLIKFRTMVDKVDSNGILLPDNQRITKMGKFMRSYSVDELPQLVNILLGNMSFIGPRPLLTEYLILYNARQLRRHEVMPGLTGWAQVNGRNSLSWQQKFELDIFYVDNISLYLDIRILLMTINRVIRREGIDSSQNATMPLFRGNN